MIWSYSSRAGCRRWAKFFRDRDNLSRACEEFGSLPSWHFNRSKMAFLEFLLVAVVGNAIRKTRRAARETKRRKGSPLHFDHRLRPQEFTHIVSEIARTIPRLARCESIGMTVYFEITSNSGLTTWAAEIDFNDYGRLTGTYWLTSDNTQSNIPEFFAERIQREICRRIA